MSWGQLANLLCKGIKTDCEKSELEVREGKGLAETHRNGVAELEGEPENVLTARLTRTLQPVPPPHEHKPMAPSLVQLFSPGRSTG